MPIPPIPPIPQPSVPSTQVAYGNAGSAITSSPALTFDGTNLNVTGAGAVVDSLTSTTDYVAGTALEGDIGYSSTDKNWESADAVGSAAFRRLLNAEVADGTTITAAAETSLYSSTVPVPGNSLTPGRTVRFEYFGILSTAVAAPGTLTFKVKLGSTVIATVTTPTLVTSLSSNGFSLTGYLVCRTAGAGGTFEGNAVFSVVSETTGLPVITDRGLGHNVSVDTTASIPFGVTATFSATGNSITARSRVIEI